MTIRREDVLRTAELAEIAVADDEMPRLVEQLARIVAYVEQLSEVPAGEAAEPYLGGPPQVALREDVIAPAPLARPVSSIAPEFRDGFFLVPRRGALADE